jgi:PAS domain S-box-containing protein
MSLAFTFQETEFSNLFPFYIRINEQIVVKSIGKTLKKICPDVDEKNFFDGFKIKRPQIDDYTFDTLKSLEGQLITIECNDKQKTNLRGQLDFRQATNELIFLGSLWFNSIDALVNTGLTLNDFAHHDPLTDFLHLLKTQEITNDDLRYLLNTVNKQKNELKEANKVIHDIALFPTQNPDPLFRIDFNGDLLGNNPAASNLDFIEFEDKLYRNDFFFKIIAKRVDPNKSRTEFEGSYEGRDYSFVCIPMKEEGYINIYGRDITQQLIDREEVEKLSTIIQQTKNAVIITDAKGKIEWVNSAFIDITEFKLEEIKGKSPGSFLQGKDTSSSTVEYMREKIRYVEPFTCEVYNYTKSGKGCWLRINAQPVFNKAGKHVQYFAMQEDITLEKQAKAKIAEFDKRSKVALEKIGDNIWEHDFSSGVTSFSKKEADSFGYDSKEFNSNIDFWYSLVHPGDKKMLVENHVKYLKGNISNHALEYRVLSKDGSINWILDRGVLIEKTVDNKPLKIIGTHTNITTQKAIEKELEQRVQQFNSLSQNIPGIIYEYQFKPDGTEGIKYVSPSVKKVFGLTSEEFQNYISYIHADDLDKILVRNRESRKNKTPFSEEARILIPGKELRWHSISSSYSYTEENGNIVFTGFMMDVTVRKTVEQKIDEQKKFYEQILNNIPADIAVFNASHEYLFLNPNAIKDVDLRNWMIGKRDEDYVAKRNKPISILEGRRRIFNRTVETKELQSWEEPVPQPDGTSKYVLRNMFPVPGHDGNIKLVIGYGIDITASRKIQQQIIESEKRYRDVIDNSLVIITTHDMQGKFLSVNPIVSKILGYKDSEMIGHSLVDFLSLEDKHLFETNYLNKIKDEKSFSGIFRVLHKNGNVIYNLFNNYLKEEPGKDPYVIAFAVDITERIVAEKELKLAKKITDELAKTKQNFLANMSHEIRTPLNGIMGMASQLQKTNLNKDQLSLLQTIRSASDNLLVVINDILDLSKMEAGKLSLEKIGFEPRTIIGRAMKVMKHKAEERGLAFTNSFFDTKISDVLIGDPYRLNQILLNLISNAIKFTEKGSVNITCSVIEETDTSQKVRTIVKDTGIGMEEAFVQKLFQKFSQEDESVTRKYGGTGLGMSISKDLVEMMGGKIYVESAKGEGTAVSFEISFTKGTLEDLPKTHDLNTDVKILVGKCILIADDNKMNRMVAGAVLKNYGCKLIEAVDGADALEKVKEHNPDIVLMDVQMPEMDGLEATKIIRAEISSELPIIALTALAIRGDDDKCKAAGMNDYLTKPYEESQLINMLSKWLGTKQIKEQNEIKPMVSPQSLFSLAKIEALARDNPDFVDEIVDIFIEQAILSMQQMRAAFEIGDLTTVKKVAHRLRASIDNMCIDSLKQEIRDLETDADRLFANNLLYPKLENMDLVLSRIVAYLQEHRR